MPTGVGRGRFGRDASGAVAVEFALVAPVLLAIFFGGYALSQCVSVSRKVSITTRALADLTTQATQVSAADMTSIISAASQIMAPYDATQLSARVTGISTDSNGNATVAWCRSTGVLSQYSQGQTIAIPSVMRVPNLFYVLGETKYHFAPVVSIGVTTMNFGDNIYMLPRRSNSVNYTG